MKISKLIEELNKIQDLYGDKFILLEDDEELSYDLIKVYFSAIEDAGYVVLSAMK